MSRRFQTPQAFGCSLSAVAVAITVALMVFALVAAVAAMAAPDVYSGVRQHAIGLAGSFGSQGVVAGLLRPVLKEAATSTSRWTGVAVTTDGRVFVNFPRWSDDARLAVAEVMPDGSLAAFPDASWNYRPADPKARLGPPDRRFVCVQSVVADDRGGLWVLDPANPMFRGTMSGQAKLVRFDPATGEVVRTYKFDSEIAPAASYLNDVRIDLDRGYAYITDSGLGALVALDLESGVARRLLQDQPATKAEPGVGVTVEGRPFDMPVHCDGIALDPDGDIVYFQALTGRTLWCIPGAVLRDAGLSADDLVLELAIVGEGAASDGLLWYRGKVLLTAIEDNAIIAVSPRGTAHTVISDPRLKWPDSLALGTDGAIWITTSQIHLGDDPAQPFRLLKLEFE